MPTKSPAQKRLMQTAAHNPAFAKKTDVPVTVAKEFIREHKAAAKRQGAKK